MMRRTKKGQCYSAGERGRNRVRVFPDPKTGVFQIECRRNGRRESKSLKHRDFEKAKAQADKLAASFPSAGPEPEANREPEPLTLGRLFEMYLEEVTPTKGKQTQGHDYRAAQMFTEHLGDQRPVLSLNRQDWDGFIQARRGGMLRPAGSTRTTGVGDRVIEQNLQFIRAVLNWATVAGDETGDTLLDRNPFNGFPLPKERNPRRVLLTDLEYRALLAVAPEVDWRYEVLLVLAHETGHRIGAVRQLRWSDVDLETGLIRWRAKTEKTGYEHVTPMSDRVHAALEAARSLNPGIGEAPVLPAPKEPSQSVSRNLARDWWSRGVTLAGLAPVRGRGWHSFRRKFASDLVDEPLKVLADLGGWKSTKTIIECYQRPDQDRLRAALIGRHEASS